MPESPGLELESRLVPTVLGRVRIAVAGEGVPILFWPSLLLDGSIWSAQAERFAGSHRVVLIDPPGQGGSEPLRRHFTLGECATVVTELLDALGAERGHVVGNSWGGMTAAVFAAEHPDRAATVVALNATAGPAPRLQRLRYVGLSLPARALGGLRGPLERSAIAEFLGPTSRRERPAVVETVRTQLRAVDVASSRFAIDSIVPRRPDQRLALGGVSAPALVVAGAEDSVFPVADAEALAAAIPGARLEVLDRCGHLAALERPDAVNDLIAGHIAG